MPLKRRDFLSFLSGVAGTIAVGSVLKSTGQKFSMPFQSPAGETPIGTSPITSGLSFQPVKSPIPSVNSKIALDQQIAELKQFKVVDDLVLPEGFTYDVIAGWGDKVGDSRFGYNNDYLSFVETAPNEGYLTINFEYISAIPWLQSYEKVLGQSLPFKDVEAALKKSGDKGLDASKLPAKDALKAKIRAISEEALIDQGMGVISIRKTADGRWERTNSSADRRITGISGLNDDRYLKCTGAAKAVFLKKAGQGYVDKLGDRIIGTFGNCAGGTTPWGTVLSGEENIQTQVPDAVYADGTSFPPSQRTFLIDEEEVSGQGNVLGLAGNKYGWVVEVDPSNPNDYGTKHTWLGRYRHEAVGVRVEAGKPLAFYSGCDRRGGHIYKFVSQDAVTNPTDKANSRLLENGMLYAAKFNADGTGKWIALKADTAVNPDLPSQMVGKMLTLPDRPKGGYKKVGKDAEVVAFKKKFKTLGDLYVGSPEEKQGAILIDAHYAASAVGSTCTARPEDTEIAPDGSLYIAFTSGSPSGGDGGPDKRIFKGPKGETPYEYGFVMHVIEDANEPAAMTFTWKMLALGGEAAAGGAGFANPDNLLIDPSGNVWLVCDMTSDKVNKPPKGKAQADRRGLFGNNGLWFVPTSGGSAGSAHLFAMGPMECELTGPFLTRDQQTLFLAVQHPGEYNGIRQAMKSETRKFTIKTQDGKEFTQDREVPIGSNFPSKQANDPPKPSIVAVRRSDQRSVTAIS
ncbi:PhoX family protein [Phormidesmis sp. 146-33]